MDFQVPPPSEQLNDNITTQKSLIGPIALTALIFTVLSGLLVYFIQQREISKLQTHINKLNSSISLLMNIDKKTAVVTTTTSNTEETVLYDNKLHGYSIKLPKSAVIDESKKSEYGSVLTETEKNDKNLDKLCVSFSYKSFHIMVSAASNVGHKYTICGRTGVGVGAKFSSEQIETDGQTIMASKITDYDETAQVVGESYSIPFDDGTMISFNYGNQYATTSTYEQYLKEKNEMLTILKTFKLEKKAFDYTNWGTFENNDISIQYPTDWTKTTYTQNNRTSVSFLDDVHNKKYGIDGEYQKGITVTYFDNTSNKTIDQILSELQAIQYSTNPTTGEKNLHLKISTTTIEGHKTIKVIKYQTSAPPVHTFITAGSPGYIFEITDRSVTMRTLKQIVSSLLLK